MQHGALRALLSGNSCGRQLRSRLFFQGSPKAAAAAAAAAGRRWSSSAAEGGSAGEQQLVASVILERLPVLLPELPQWEIDYLTFSFERRQLYRKEYPAEFIDMGSSVGVDEGDLTFEPAPRETEADRTNDIRSVQRALDKRLFFIVHGQPLKSQSNVARWHFPEKPYDNEDTMRQCAEAALARNVGTNMEVYFVGNAPCGHLPSLSEPNLTRFFFRSQFLDGRILLQNQKLKDYAWVTKEELANYFEDYGFYQKMLI